MDRLSYLLKSFLPFYVLTFLSCKSNIDTKNVFEKALKSDSLSYYFPSILNDTFERRNSSHKDFEQNWYSSSLYSLKEPILFTKTDSVTIYRLLWLRSFDKPVCIVVKEFNGNYFINAKTIDRQPNFYPYVECKSRNEITGKQIFDTIQKADRFALIDFDRTKVMTNGKWKEIQIYLSKIDFWNSPISDPNDDGSMDGSNWILEGRKNGKYHFIIRRNARDDLKELGKKLVKWSEVEIKDKSFY